MNPSSKNSKHPSVIPEESRQTTKLFLHLVSHDLGVPFTAFRNKFFENLVDESNPWKLRENIMALSETVYRLDRVVRDLVDTAAIEDGSIRLKSESVDLTSVISDRISRRLRRLRGYRFQPDIPTHIQAIQGDKKRLTTLIDDLFDVVILLSPAGGTILVNLSLSESEVKITALNRSAIIPAGSSESFLEWLGRNLKDGDGLEGVGIALYRSYLTAKMLGGNMDLETPADGGVSITVRFPYEKFESFQNA